MLRLTKILKGYRLGALDGEIGHLKDFYFDDHSWTVRYLVADTGDWLPHRKVLLSPHSVLSIHPDTRTLEVNLSKRQIEESPSIDTHQPVSRRFEAQYYQYYGWPYYWPGPFAWGPLAIPSPLPSALPPTEFVPPPETDKRNPEDSNLRSAGEITGYHIQALDHDFGHVEQLVVDEHDWAIRYLVVDTRNWWPGKRVLVAPDWISWVSWREMRVYLDLDQKTIQAAPEYVASEELTRDYEQRLHAYYGRTPYWESHEHHLV